MSLQGPSAWLAPIQDYITLAGIVSPGKATVRGGNAPRSWDERKGYGFSGATLVYTGDKLAKFEVDIELWTNEHWADWEFFSLLLEKPPVGELATAMDIGHPLLNMSPWKIQSVVIEDVLQFEADEFENFRCTIKFIQFRAPVPMIGSPKVSVPDAAPPLAPETETQKAIAQAEMERDAEASGVNTGRFIKPLPGE